MYVFLQYCFGKDKVGNKLKGLYVIFSEIDVNQCLTYSIHCLAMSEFHFSSSVDIFLFPLTCMNESANQKI